MSTSRGENRREVSRMMSMCRLKRRHPLQPTSSNISVGGTCRIDAFARHFFRPPPADRGKPARRFQLGHFLVVDELDGTTPFLAGLARSLSSSLRRHALYRLSQTQRSVGALS
jgi:hypothetical protein